MLVQNNSTNFGSITKFKVKPQDLEHFKKNIYKKFKPGENFVFSEHFLHEVYIQKLKDNENFNAIAENLKNKGFDFNDSLRLNSEDKQFNMYLVNEPKDIKKVYKQTASFVNQVKSLFHMVGTLKWATKEIQPKNQTEAETVKSLGILKFTDDAAKKFEKYTQKLGIKEFKYIARADGEIGLKSTTKTDGIKFSLKVKDSQNFFDTVYERIANHLEKKHKTVTYILENPRYNQFEENYEKLEFGNWASQNLRHKGFETSIPKGENPENTLDLYLFTSDKSQKQLFRKFDGFRGFLDFVKDSGKANFVAKIFSNMVGGAKNDIHYSDAATFLYEHDLNMHQDIRFQKFLDTVNMKEIEFKPKK